MSEQIQRWHVVYMSESGWEMAGQDDGRWVEYADHVEALRQARADVWAEFMTQFGPDDPVYRQGQRDALANPDLRERIITALHNEGADNEDGWHGWRCFDKGRYPEPCTCTAEVADEILRAIKGDSDE